MKIKTLLPGIIFLHSIYVHAQPGRWQQKISYTIDVKMDVLSNRFTGIEKFDYYNNSPDTLKRLFIHLYWNAFHDFGLRQFDELELRHLGQQPARSLAHALGVP